MPAGKSSTKPFIFEEWKRSIHNVHVQFHQRCRGAKIVLEYGLHCPGKCGGIIMLVLARSITS